MVDRFAYDDTPEVDAPNIFLLLRETDLVEGNPHLHAPAFVVDHGLPFPHAVPGAVAGDIVGQGLVHDRADRIDPEEISRPPVVIGIDGEYKPVRVH